MSTIKTLLMGAALAASALATSQATAAELVTNGSFENLSNFNPDGRDTDILTNGSTAMTGWTVTGGERAEIGWIGPSNPFGLTASNGSYFLDLTGDVDGTPYGGVSQTFRTVSGAKYVVTFDLGSSTNYGIQDGLTVTAGDQTGVQFTTTNNGNNTNLWESETLTFTATGATTTLVFQGDQSNPAYIGLDNVSVSGPAVPEPTTWALMLVGVAGLGVALRSRRHTATV